ncbi:MAG: C10 family peptidase [Prevotellaceae bacterium]|nr:C10 family peptidase [Prevotellaceae bacterium]
MRNLLTTLLLAVAISLPAQTLMPEKAKQNALEYLNSNSVNAGSLHKKAAASPEKLELAYTSYHSNLPTYYVFNSKDGGFVIASANEVAEPILVYAPEGTFDYSSLPANFKWWLSQYDEQISYFSLHPSAVRHSPKTAESKKDVPYLCQTGWDQDSPYNLLCPKVSTRNCITGCVATAMSQVMKVYEWPVTGTGSHSYYDSYGCKKDVSTNFYEHSYDWANMQNTYNNRSTDDQKQAVAQLMFDAGVSVEMQYGTDGSAAYTEAVPYAFANFFGYDPAVSHAYRSYYEDDEWAEMIYAELAAGHPVMYGGCTPSGEEGHSFICDGYKASDNTYHFNWGWGLSLNCYCKLSAVKGGGYTWSTYQDIVYGIQKPVEGSVAQPNLILYDECSLYYTTTKNDSLTNYNINFGKYTEGSRQYSGFIWNDAWGAFDVMFTMKYTNTATGEVFYAAQDSDQYRTKVHFSSVYPVETYGGFTSLKINNVRMPHLRGGSYRVSLAYRLWEERDIDNDSLWRDVRAYTSCKNYVDLEVECTLDTPKVLKPTEVTDSSFTANWTPVEEAEGYTLELTVIDTLNTVFDAVIHEDFSKFDATSDGTKDIGETLDRYMNTPGWTGSKVYNSMHQIKLGSSTAGSTLRSPLIANPRGKLTLSFTEMYFGSDPTVVTVSVVDLDGNTIGEAQKITVNGESHELEFADINSNCYVMFTAPAKRRYYISAIDIQCAGVRSEKLTIDSLQTTSYTFVGLNPKNLYEYRVQAYSIDGTSKWSETMPVTLGNLLLGDANGDGEVNVADITTIASFILGGTPDAWNAVNADADQDGSITVADITTTANIILTK